MLVEPAYEALLRAMDSDDMKSAVRAAEVILDRAGLGPKSTLVLEDSRDNLANLSQEELAQRAQELADRARLLASRQEAEQAVALEEDEPPTSGRTH